MLFPMSRAARVVVRTAPCLPAKPRIVAEQLKGRGKKAATKGYKGHGPHSKLVLDSGQRLKTAVADKKLGVRPRCMPMVEPILAVLR